jgi:hypothetical protein
MNDNTTYPPVPTTHTTAVPPSSPTAFTGSNDIPAISATVVVLALLGAVAVTWAMRRGRG